MFKKATFTTTLGLGLFAFVWLFKLVYLFPSDYKKLQEIKKMGKAVAQTVPDRKTHQLRKGVRKDLWLAQQDKTRLHYRIDSKSSTLTLLPIEDKVDIIENLHQIQCWMQDKLYNQGNSVMQQMRFFEADQGIYQYSTQRFSASTVTLSLFRLPGTGLPIALDPSRAFLRGIAQDVSFSVAGKTTQFQAQRFKATLSSQSVASQSEEKP